MGLIKVYEAKKAFQHLNGIFCIFKPARTSVNLVVKNLRRKIVEDLNQLEIRPPRDYVKISGSLSDGLTVQTVPSLADHPLVVGPRYQEQDISLAWASRLGWFSSGVMLMGVGSKSGYAARVISNTNQLRCYEIDCRFGLATDDFTMDGKVLDKSSTRHISEGRLEALLTSIQAAHQSNTFKSSGVPLASQAAYDLASQGLVRPSSPNTSTLIYGLQLTSFRAPDFTLRVQCTNEREDYLLELVHDLGLRMKSCAVCVQMRRTDYGQFGLKRALLSKHWDLENIMQNIADNLELTHTNAIVPHAFVTNKRT